MARMIQIRHVPDDVHRKLKARAALAGMSLSEYLLSEVRHTLEQPTLAEMMERLSRRRPVRVRETPAALIRRERDRR
jgi:antitoxin FitA